MLYWKPQPLRWIQEIIKRQPTQSIYYFQCNFFFVFLYAYCTSFNLARLTRCFNESCYNRLGTKFSGYLFVFSCNFFYFFVFFKASMAINHYQAILSRRLASRSWFHHRGSQCCPLLLTLKIIKIKITLKFINVCSTKLAIL